jgi:hypothetical protein
MKDLAQMVEFVIALNATKTMIANLVSRDVYAEGYSSWWH